MDITRSCIYDKDPWNIAKLFIEEKSMIFLDGWSRGAVSYLALFPQKTISVQDNIFCTEEGKNGKKTAAKTKDAFKELKRALKATRQGRWFGYLAYPMVRYVENIKINKKNEFPDMFFVLPKIVIEFPYNKKQMNIYGKERDIKVVEKMIREKRIKEKSIKEKKIRKEEKIREEEKDRGRRQEKAAITNIKSNFTKKQYIHAINKAKQYILEGDSFQIKLSQRFTFNMRNTNPAAVYERLRKINPSPYSAFVKLKGLHVLCSSPEHLLSIRNNDISTTPIGGTYPYQKEDGRTIIKKFKNDEKELAEHIMLIDLERNDLGKGARAGSVKVDKFMKIEKYSHLVHLVTNITAEKEKNKDTIDIIKAMFPGGTVTGCPKIRTMEIIDELEKTNRSLYTGSLGWIDAKGDCTLNIIIRTIIINTQTKKGFLQVGGGIVADSNPEKEYQETFWKAKALFESLGVTSVK